MKKGQILEGRIERVDFPNKGIVTTEEGKEVLIPAIHDCILDVDVEANRMEIHLLDGLLD